MPTVLITGSSRGIGLGLVKEFLERKWTVIATCREPESASDLKEVLQAAGQNPPVACDVTKDDSISQCFENVKQLVGHIDMLINNAGITTPESPYDPPSKLKREELIEVMNTNAAGLAIMTQTFMPLLLASKDETRRKVLNIGGSLGSISLVNNINSTSYRCSKIAVNMLTKTFALEFPQVTFIAIHPGWVQTDMGSSNNRCPPLTVQESCTSILNVVEKRTKEDSGTFWGFDGKPIQY